MRFCAVLAMLLAVAGFAGCRGCSAPPTPPPVETPFSEVAPDAPDPYAILDRMVAAYKTAMSYSDQATVQIVGRMSQPDLEPVPWNCIVAFLRPNMLRIEVNDGIFVSDGEDCYAQIQMLPDQVLHFPAPASWTLEALFQDVHLDAAMALGLPRSVLRFPPQLVLLFANNPLNTFVPRGAEVKWIAQQQIGECSCDVIQISHSDGNRLLWICEEHYALLRMDYQPVGLPVPEGFDSIESIRIEMTDALFDYNFGSDTFQMLQPQDAVQVAEFHSDVFGLPASEEHRRRLGLMTDNDTYRLVDPHIESVISPEQASLPQTTPRTFTLSQVWIQSLVGAGPMTFWLDEPRKLLIPCEGNVVAVLDLQGNVLQRISPEGLEDSIIMDIQSNSFSDRRRIGILTLDSRLHLFDESFKPVADSKEDVRYFRFVRHDGEELLLLAVSGSVYAVDSQGVTRWECSFEGKPNQISSATLDDQLRVLVSCTASADLILVLSPEGLAFEPVEISFGKHVLWFQVVDSTFYTLLENTDTGDVRFVGFDVFGKNQWSRLLPPGEYEVDPVYISSEKKWLVPSPSGEILVFDLMGNMIDAFSLNVVPTGLLCLAIDGETLLIVADGETVSAWKLEK